MCNLMDKIKVSERLDSVVEESLNRLKDEKRRKRRKKVLVSVSGAAAVFAYAFIFFNANPAMAAKLPVIGELFDQIEETVSYKGNYSEHSDVLLSEKEINKLEEGEIVDSPYVQISNGITVAVSEVSYSGQALYLAMEIRNEEAFPESFYGNAVSENVGYQRLYLECSSGTSGENYLMYAEGYFKDEHTFIGIIRHDTTGFIRGDGSGVFGINYYLEIDAIRGDAADAAETAAKKYDGEWNFKIHAEADPNQICTVEVGAEGERGFIIKGVVRTPYEVHADIGVPEGQDAKGYITLICDANGDLLPRQGDDWENYSTYQRDTSKVSVFVCDYDEYMDQLKAHYIETADQMTYAEYLSEYALVSAEVAFETE